jgi:hypothetical protein
MCSNMYMTSSSWSTDKDLSHMTTVWISSFTIYIQIAQCILLRENVVSEMSKCIMLSGLLTFRIPTAIYCIVFPQDYHCSIHAELTIRRSLLAFEIGKKRWCCHRILTYRLLKPYHKSPCHGVPKPKRCSSIVFENAGTSHKSELQEHASTSLRILHAGGGGKSCHFLNDPFTLFKFSTLMLNSYIVTSQD